MIRKASVVALAAVGLLAASPSSHAQPQTGANGDNPAAFIKKWGGSNERVLDLKAVENAAHAKFAALDKNHDGTLTEQELTGVLTPEEFKAADLDHDNTISAQEWSTMVERQFKKADLNHDGSLSQRELRDPSGQKLLKEIG